MSAADPSTTSDGRDRYECARAWVALRSTYARVNECLQAGLGRACGLTVNDFEVLVHLASAEPHQPRLGDLHVAVALSQPALSRLVARLEHQSLICRTAASHDRRAVLIALTDQGHALLHRAIPIHAACVREILTRHLTEAEQDALIASLTHS